MSNESLLRGITHKDLKSLIGKALQDGWEFVGVSGKTMAVIQFRGGRKYQFSMTPSGSNAHKNINSDLRAISGRSYLPQAKTGRGKGGEKGTDFSIPQANKEQFHYHKSHRGISEETLQERHTYLISKFTHFARKGNASSNQDINTCIRVLKDIRDLEKLFHSAFPHIPMEDFDPEDIRGDIIVPSESTSPLDSHHN